MSQTKSQAEKDTLKDLNKILKLLDKVKESNTFVGVVIDEKFYDNFNHTLQDATNTFKKEIEE